MYSTVYPFLNQTTCEAWWVVYKKMGKQKEKKKNLLGCLKNNIGNKYFLSWLLLQLQIADSQVVLTTATFINCRFTSTSDSRLTWGCYAVVGSTMSRGKCYVCFHTRGGWVVWTTSALARWRAFSFLTPCSMRVSRDWYALFWAFIVNCDWIKANQYLFGWGVHWEFVLVICHRELLHTTNGLLIDYIIIMINLFINHTIRIMYNFQLWLFYNI